MKYSKIIISVAMLIGMLYSCRQEDDFVKSYGGNEKLVMLDASSSFTKQFEALWKAVNSNYVAWEIETVNWDEVYDKYYPVFQELDTLCKDGDTISSKRLEEIYTEILDTLHDGHSNYEIQNLTTKDYISVFPQLNRNIRRFGKNIKVEVPYDLSYYQSDLVPQTERFDTISYTDMSAKNYIKTQLRWGYLNLMQASLQATTAEERIRLNKYIYEIENLIDLIDKNKYLSELLAINNYNTIVYAVPEALMTQYDTEIDSSVRIKIMSGITTDGIAYLRFSNFYLTPVLSSTEEALSQMAQNGLPVDSAMYAGVKNTWALWFGAIQQLSAINRLKGVIIDLRGNGGGSNSDQAHVIGALLPKGGHRVGTYKMKNGTGRLDYTVDMEFKTHTMINDHVVIADQPIVVLVDHNSVSNSEMTAVIAKQLPNGVVIGSQTFGGLSCVAYNWENYNVTYSGEFGVRLQTPIYGYQPICIVNYDGYGILEGKGVTPTEGYNMEYEPTTVTDAQGYELTRDNQLEAALKYIRNK